MRYNEISHFSHPQHKLTFEHSEFPFKCDGCKEIGIGSHYKCNICDYDLHTHCTILPSTTLFHPFYTKCTFQFISTPPGNTPRYCNACEKDINGFVYHCKTCGFDLHPCCAKLPMILNDGGMNMNMNMKLYLYRKVSSPCPRCGRKGRSWSYRSSCKRYNLHVGCVREMVVENWGRKDEREKGCCLENSRGRRGSKGKVKKCCEIAGFAVQIVISAVLGDPTVLIAGVVGALMSRS